MPYHSTRPPEAQIDVRQRARAGLRDPAADHDPVGVEAVDQHVTVRQRFELRAIVVDAMPHVVEAGASEVGEVAAVG